MGKIKERRIKEIKERMVIMLNYNPYLVPSSLAKTLNVPLQTVLWLSEDIDHHFFES